MKPLLGSNSGWGYFLCDLRAMRAIPRCCAISARSTRHVQRGAIPQLTVWAPLQCSVIKRAVPSVPEQPWAGRPGANGPAAARAGILALCDTSRHDSLSAHASAVRRPSHRVFIDPFVV